jgi:FkbM family methyltransferase
MSASVKNQLNLAQQHYQTGNYLEAEAIFRQVVQQHPQQAEALFWLALIADQLGRPLDSIAYYEQVIRLQPTSAEAHGNLGSVFMKVGRLEDAIAHHRESLRLSQNSAKAHYNLAIALYQNNQVEEAIDHYRQAIASMPDYANAHHNLGMALYKQGQVEAALQHYRRAVELEPNHTSARNSLGVALYQQGQLEAAIEQYQQALAISPGYISAHDNLGIALKQQQKLTEAAVHFQQAIALNPHYANAYINLSNTLREMGRFEEAIVHAQEAIRLQPSNADAHNTYGCILVDLGQFEEAIVAFEAAIQHRPDFADAHLNLGLVLLQLGHFQRGFVEYHWRWSTAQCPDLRYTNALWKGAELHGKTILLTAEQGFGDTIQFARYAPLVAQRGGRVVIACQKPLVRLLSTVPGVSQCVDRDKDDVETHTHTPLLELPLIFGTTLDTIPAQVPYVSPPPDSSLKLKVPPQTRLKVGFVWATNPNNSTSLKRSCPLSHFLSLLDVPGIALYSLQKDAPEADRALLNSEERIQNLAEQLSDFADTAAAIAQLDLVITVDTAVAHLSGALGKPTWTLLPAIPDWRWLLNREDSPWYPTMRLFRQSQPNDWAELFTRVITALQTELSHPRPSFLPNKRFTETSLPIHSSPHPPIHPLHSPTVPSSPPALSLPGSNRLKQCRYGVFLYNPHDQLIGRSLDLYGEWSEGEIKLFQSLIQPGQTVVEVGTDLGAHTIFVAKAAGLQGKVLAFEPQRLVFQCLCANLALNHLTNTFPYAIALGDRAGLLSGIDLAQSLNRPVGGGNYSPEPVQVATLDSFAIAHCHFIKFNVGTRLLPVLQGAAQTLQKTTPILYVVSDRPSPPIDALAYLQAIGYALYWHHPPLYNPDNFCQNSHNVFGSATLNNVLAFHRSLNITVNGLEPISRSRVRSELHQIQL